MKEDDSIAIFSIPVIVAFGLYLYAFKYLKLLWTIMTVDMESQGDILIDGESIPFSNIAFLLKIILLINMVLFIVLCLIKPPTPKELYDLVFKDSDWIKNRRGSIIMKPSAVRSSTDFPEWASSAKRLHVTGDGVSGFYARDPSYSELVFRLQGGNTLLCPNGREWFFIRRGTTKMRYVPEDMEIRLIEEIEVKPTDQSWGIGNALFNDQKHCDVIIRFRNGDSLLAHRCILETALPVWKRNWQNLFSSDKKPKDKKTIVMKDETPQTIREFIKAVYTRNVPKDPDLLITVGRLAGKYQDWPLVYKCCEELVEVLDAYPEYHIKAKELIEGLPRVQSGIEKGTNKKIFEDGETDVETSLLRAIARAFESCLSSKLDDVISRFNEDFKLSSPKRRQSVAEIFQKIF